MAATRYHCFSRLVSGGLSMRSLFSRPARCRSRTPVVERLEDRSLLSFLPVGTLFSTAPAAVAAADFNGDGLSDLAAAESDRHQVAVWLSNGDGSFRRFASFPTGRGPHSVAVGDFNGDGLADLVTADAVTSTLTMLLGDGSGSFKRVFTAFAWLSP